MAKLSPSRFADFVKDRCHDKKDGYLFGARGEYCKNLSKSHWLITQYSGAQRQKALYWLEHAERVWDCWGFAEGYVNQETGSNIDMRAKDGYASWCDPKGKGKIPAARRVPGAAVFMGYGTASGINHVGYLIRPVGDNPNGDWYVGEARGVMYGCVITKLSERSWTHWGWMTKHFDYDETVVEVIESGPIRPSDGDDSEMGDSQKNPYAAPDRILKYKAGQPMMRGQDVKWVQWELCQEGDGYEVAIDGDYVPNTAKVVKKFQAAHGCDADGEVGPVTVAAMLACYGSHEPPKPDSGKGIIIDVSHHNSADWDKAVASVKIDFAIIRVQDNTTLDRNLRTNIKAVTKHGIPYGVYAFVRCKNEAAARKEADLFVDRALEHSKGLDQPRIWMVDAEVGNPASAVLEFGRRVKERLKALGLDPLIGLYASDSDMINRYKNIVPKFHRIWTADWRKACKKWADLWCKLTDLWQYGYITVKGLGSTVDGNRLPDDVTVEQFISK